jgi:hypothetical protein
LKNLTTQIKRLAHTLQTAQTQFENAYEFFIARGLMVVSTLIFDMPEKPLGPSLRWGDGSS